MQRYIWCVIAAAALALAACGSDGGSSEPTTETDDNNDAGLPDADAETSEDVSEEAEAEADADAADGADAQEDTSPGCEENAAGALPEEVEWITLDGRSDEILATSDGALPEMTEGEHGTYNFNTLEIYGANGFRFETPITVYGAQARWTNLPEDEAVQATLRAWPDFGSNGFSFDIDHPRGSYTRCLSAEDDARWTTYTFPEPIEFDQPGRLFVGYHRGEVEAGPGGQPQYTEPELMFENFQALEAPYFAGAWFPDYDEERFYQGLSTPWFTWQVRLAVVRHDDIPDEDKSFSSEGSPELSRRVAWGDFDNDGDADLMTSGPRLWRNEGDGQLVDVTGEAIGELARGTGGGVWGDYDNDGCLDYFGQGGRDTLLKNNCDGTFSDVTEDAGIDDTQNIRDCNGDGEPEPSPTQGAAWIDVDGDGFLDLYLANYECSSEHDYYNNYVDRLFINRGDGTFAEAEDAGVSRATHAGRGASAIDFDRDGDTDLYVSNYRLDPNFHYVNRGDGTFEEEARDLGTQGEETSGAYGHTIGSVFGDIDGDGDFDLITANLAHPRYCHFSDRTRIYTQRRGEFVDDTRGRGLVYRETHSNPTLFDADNDGDLDLFITCVYEGRDSDFYENDGEGNFTLRNYESGLVIQNGWGAAAADFDNDGDVDIAASRLFENNTTDPGHWLQVRAVGVGGNTSAIGAVIEVQTEAGAQIRAVSGGSGTSSQSSLVQHFGLGEAEATERVTVSFPYGEEVTVEDVAADQRIWIYSDGFSEVGFAPPRPLGE